MLLVISLLRWWYTDGLRQRIAIFGEKLAGTMDYFSAGLLLKTLFSPFRQISAGRVDGPLETQLRAMIDKLFSRAIGAIVRLVILLIGGIAICLQVILSVVFIAGWLVLPIAPFLGVVLAVIGVKP